MPVTTYMQRHPRHDHSFSSPDPRLTKEFNVPNACNRCHTDKDTDWAVAAYKDLYGEKPDSPARTRALLVARARQGDPSVRDGLIQWLANEPIAAWRGTACHLLARWVYDPAARTALLGAVADDSPLVREAAVRSLGILARENQAEVRSALKPLLEDSIRSVRVAAAWALCDTLDLSSKAGRELCHMLDINADQPTGRMQLGQFAMRRNDPAAAIRQMRKAIEWDPNSPPFHHDLAILLSTTGDAKGAVNALQEAARLDPENADYQFNLALAWNELGSPRESLAALEKTVKLDPGHARAWYNLGLTFSGMNQPSDAIAALRRGESTDPTDAGIPYARATIHARLGENQEALAAAARALQLRPDFQEARQLIGTLSR
jgi:tetratricopeptide (TPR) repeat protein